MTSTEDSAAETGKSLRVLIVEDDPGDVKLVRGVLTASSLRCRVEVVGEVSAAIARLAEGAFNVVLLDMGLPDSNGVDTVLRVHRECPDVPIVVLTGLDDEEVGLGAVRIGAQDYLVKGNVTSNLLTRAIRYAIERKRMEIENRKLERQAQAAHRLATVGQLSLGAAHEIDNPLTSVIGFSELLQQEDLPEEIAGKVEIIHRGALRVAGIVDRLRTFARSHKPELTYVAINDILNATLDIQAHQLEMDNIRVTTKLATGLPATLADAGQLQQVFLNILLNAGMEMKLAHDGGELFIGTEAADNIIRVSFADDGPGIAPENREKIFDPFFTTRGIGEGTGLGLSICHGIVTEHGGKIYAESELGQGATFFVELPVVTPEGGED